MDMPSHSTNNNWARDWRADWHNTPEKVNRHKAGDHQERQPDALRDRNIGARRQNNDGAQNKRNSIETTRDGKKQSDTRGLTWATASTKRSNSFSPYIPVLRV